MKLEKARLCLKCNWIFHTYDKCPSCSSGLWISLESIVPSPDIMDIIKTEKTPDTEKKRPWYKQWWHRAGGKLDIEIPT